MTPYEETEERIKGMTENMVDLLEDERSDDAITALLRVMAQELSYMCPNCRPKAAAWLTENMPKMIQQVEEWIAEHGEVEACDEGVRLRRSHLH